jgi:hypothetical protein
LDPVFQQEGEGLAGGGGVWLRHRQPGQREGARPAAQPPGATALTPLSIVTEPRTDLEPAPPVRIDPARLERIVTDLLDNAVRHGAPPIVVTTDTASGYVQLTVHDAELACPPSSYRTRRNGSPAPTPPAPSRARASACRSSTPSSPHTTAI